MRPTWFDKLGQCGGCNRAPATGVLKSERNEAIGPRCEPCARGSIQSWMSANAGPPRIKRARS